MRPRKTPTDSQYKRLLEVRLACPDIRRACNLARAFADLVRHHCGYLLLEWIRQAEQDAPKPMQGFAGFLRQDLDAVTAGLTLGWSSGVVEGHVNRAKTLKRAMYGRASFELLPARILTLFGADSDGQLADFIASQYADQADALVFACLLHLAEDGSGARLLVALRRRRRPPSRRILPLPRARPQRRVPRRRLLAHPARTHPLRPAHHVRRPPHRTTAQPAPHRSDPPPHHPPAPPQIGSVPLPRSALVNQLRHLTSPL
ncbi:transposase [Streptomyces sp. NPDC085866]|uniref:transposase n=1 Tax=Streptomyces sp. NPDC085866 TaxID=3365736 RepID=UPI0037D4BD80